MNSALAIDRTAPSRAPGHDYRELQAVAAADPLFTRRTVGGPLSITVSGPIRIDAEPGLVVRVQSGCLWVPHAQEHCSVGVGPGEDFVVLHLGALTAMANERTQVELEWPAMADVPVRKMT